MTDKELVDALRLCASHGSFCVGCPRRDVAGLSCMNELMLEAADRIAAGIVGALSMGGEDDE